MVNSEVRIAIIIAVTKTAINIPDIILLWQNSGFQNCFWTKVIVSSEFEPWIPPKITVDRGQQRHDFLTSVMK